MSSNHLGLHCDYMPCPFSRISTVTVKIECDLLDSLFIRVLATLRFFCPTWPRHQRIRYTIPSRLWKWKEVTGWHWKGSKEHINVLEMRATLTTVRWWILKQHRRNCRAIHLLDSMVVLHALSRGRSSSRKLRRTVMRIGALLLLSNIQPLWAYVHTSQNPADRPSRRLKVKKWGKVKKC